MTETGKEFLKDLKAHKDCVDLAKHLVSTNRDVFAENDFELGEVTGFEMSVAIGDHPPINIRPYKVPLKQRDMVTKTIKDMLEAKIIETIFITICISNLYCEKKIRQSK